MAAGVVATRVASAAHRVDALAGGGAHGHDGGLRQERAREVVAHVHLLQLTPLVVDQVGLGERDEAVLQTHQLEDAEVLFALRFPALGGRHHEHARIDATDPRQHVAEEANVPWHVDEADAFAIAEEGVREAEVDGETAATFLFEAIWVGAGERLHQRRLAMVHVPGGGDDPHGVRAQRGLQPGGRRRRDALSGGRAGLHHRECGR